MEIKTEQMVDNAMLPIDFFGDVCDAQSAIIKQYEYCYGNKSVEIKYRPYISYAEKAQIIGSIWNLYYATNKDGYVDYYPSVVEPLLRLLTIKYYCINVPIDLNKDISTYEHFLLCTDFYDVLVKHLKDHKQLVDDLHEYIKRRVRAQVVATKSSVDVLYASLLDRANKLLDSAKKKLDVMDAKDIDSLLSIVSAIPKNGGDLL